MLQQRRVQRRGLGLPDVQTRAGEVSRLQCHVQRRFIVDAAPRGGHEAGAALHAREGFRTEHAACAGVARAVHGDKVAALEQRVQAHGLGAAQPDLRVVEQRVVREHLHADGSGECGHASAGIADAHHAQRLALELAASELLPREATFAAQPAVALGDAVRQSDDQPHRVLAHRHCIGPGLVDDGDAGAGAGVHVDRVEARTAGGGAQQLRAGLQQRLRHECRRREFVLGRRHVVGVDALQRVRGFGQCGGHGLHQQLHVRRLADLAVEQGVGVVVEAGNAGPERVHPAEDRRSACCAQD